MDRLFVFGCSLTKYDWPTWADYIGASFNEYYNYALPGASNGYATSKMIDLISNIKLKDTDVLIFMVTGLGRFTYFNKMGAPMATGDMYSYCRDNPNDKALNSFHNNLWTDEYAIQCTCDSINLFKYIAEMSGAKSHILSGVNYDYYLENTDIDLSYIKKFTKAISYIENKIPLYDWMKLSDENNDSPIFEDSGIEGHPSIYSHFRYALEHLPQYITNKSYDMLGYWHKNFVYTSRKLQATKFSQYINDTFSNILQK